MFWLHRGSAERQAVLSVVFGLRISIIGRGRSAPSVRHELLLETIDAFLTSFHRARRFGPRRVLGNPGLLVRNGERRGQDERAHGQNGHRQDGRIHGQDGHRQDGAGEEVTSAGPVAAKVGPWATGDRRSVRGCSTTRTYVRSSPYPAGAC